MKYHHPILSRGGRNFLERVKYLMERFGSNYKKIETMLNTYLVIEKELNLKCTFPVVAEVVKRYPKVFQKLYRKGMKFAFHGKRHIDYTRLKKEEQLKELKKGMELFEKYDIKVKGFRAPYTRWDENLIENVRKLNFKWEGSKTILWKEEIGKGSYQYERIIEIYNPTLSKTQVALPTLEDGVVFIPLSLPDDEILVDRLAMSWDEVYYLWEEILTQTYLNNELFVLQLHPERFWKGIKVVKKLMKRIQKFTPPIWIVGMDEIEEWWRKKRKVKLEVVPKQREWEVILEGNGRVKLGIKNLEIKEKEKIQKQEKNWIILKKETKKVTVGEEFYNIKVKKNFYSLLKEWGYFFNEKSEKKVDLSHITTPRTLLTTIETSDFPFFKVFPWPSDYKSAFSLTSDIDALSIGDFFMRIVGK
jgi:peptidoglycan/xylan/chitin deacetylase (PgdA/CDA1 family)